MNNLTKYMSFIVFSIFVFALANTPGKAATIQGNEFTSGCCIILTSDDVDSDLGEDIEGNVESDDSSMEAEDDMSDYDESPDIESQDIEE